MNALETLFARLVDTVSSPVPLLLAKVTLVLAVAWLVHAALARQNPRWRVLVWRLTAVGCMLLTGLAACPPLFEWAVLPQGEAGGAVANAENARRPASEVAPLSAAEQGRAAAQRTAELGPAEPDRMATSSRPPHPAEARQPTATHDQAIQPTRTFAAPPAPHADGRPDGRGWTTWTLLVWCGGLVVLAIRTMLGAVRVRAICRRATPVDGEVADRAGQIARDLGISRAAAATADRRRDAYPTIRASADVPTPCLVGLWRPVILLPASSRHTFDRDELTALLAHELAHVRGRDLLWNAVLHALAHALWFHPLAWRVRASHVADCDAVCDSVAASYLGDTTAYTRTLARLALRAAAPITTAGLAMARPSSIRSRIQTLQRRLFRTKPSRSRVVWLAALGFVLVTVVGTAGLTQAQSELKREAAERGADAAPSATDPDEPAENAQPVPEIMIIHAVAEETGEPLETVQIHFRGNIRGERYEQRVQTDGNGLATVQWQGKVERLTMTAEKESFVPIHYWWLGDPLEVELPTQLDLRFESGQLIGGVVQDETGQAIAGATVQVSMPSTTFPQRDSCAFTPAELTTDAEGRWKWPNAPQNLRRVGIRVAHPAYLRRRNSAESGLDQVTVLKQGPTIAGRVADETGAPIEGAHVRFGTDRFGTNEPVSGTDEEGRFLLRNCTSGPSIVTVQAEGFAPQIQEVNVGEGSDELSFRLEPGHVMRVQVVDVKGVPVEGAIFVTDTWRGYRSVEYRVNTDTNGRVEWRSAPPDVVLCDILKSGYMALRRTPISAGDQEQTVTLYPALVIEGQVTDAATGEPMPLFGVRTGRKSAANRDLYWPSDEPVTYTDGKYSYKFDEPSEGLMLEIVAPGYLPAKSRLFKSHEGTQRFDFELQPGDGPSGVVQLPGGEPAIGAQIALATRDQRAWLDLGQFDQRQNDAPIATTVGQGRFAFLSPGAEPYMLVVLHDFGYAELTREDFERSRQITLTPWGRIEGRVLAGSEPDANREVYMHPRRPSEEAHRYVADYGYTSKTDQDGRFVFERAIPGTGWISRVVVKEYEGGSTHSYAWQTPIEVAAGETTHVQIGGTGRAVVGQIRVDKKPGVEINWAANNYATISRRADDRDANGVSSRYLSYLDASGRFHIPDVPAGDYQLTVPVNHAPGPDSHGRGAEIGSAKLEFTVPEMPGGRSDEPLDLGIITAELFDTLDPGELAPDFVGERLGGGTLRMRDLHGKLVLLQFWSTRNQASLAEMPGLQEVFEQFGGNPRFSLVSLSRDEQIEAARQYVEKVGWKWLHAHTGPFSPTVQDYMVRTMPATFLIGPDGRVLAKNLRGEELKQAVAAALEDEELFQRSDVERPVRFPVVRFEPADQPQPALAETPAVIVLDNCDPEWDKDQPRFDALHALSSSGKELWAYEGLNSAQTVGGVHGVAIDRNRGRVYVREGVGDRIVAFDIAGQKLWQIEQIQADVLAVDEQSGHIWCSGGDRLNQGETIIFDRDGNQIAALPYRAIDLAYDSQSGAFWLVGYEILKLDGQGNVLFRKPVDGWCCASVSVNPTDGSVWIGERDHPDVARSKNRLWLLNSDGSTRHVLELGNLDPFVVECDPSSGIAWFSGYQTGLHRASPHGELIGEPLDLEVRNIAISPTIGDVWVTTKEAVLRLSPTGEILAEYPFVKPSSQSWLAVF